MNEKYVLVEYTNTINDTIQKIFSETQRIKKICGFGASSGSIYVFDREPFCFNKLIPSKHGPAMLISISKNEEHIAVASSSGLLLILEECFTNNSNPRQQVNAEHEGQTITAMAWSHDDCLFCGDNAGKLTSTTLKGLIYNLFTSNVIILLESSIVQIDVYEKYLLVSSRNRTVLCDTQKDTFKQIGKKPRDGPFGACFFESTLKQQSASSRSGAEQQKFNCEHNEVMSEEDANKNIRIFCARPGVRLWQAMFDSTVVSTHQFRESLVNQKQSDIVYIKSTESDARDFEIITPCPNEIKLDPNFNFGKLYKCHKSILTYKENGVYVFNPDDCSLDLCCQCFDTEPIRDLKLVENSQLYVWYNDFKIRVLSVLSVENLLISTLLRKQYYLCADFCNLFYKDILDLVGVSQKIFVLSALKDKIDYSLLGDETQDKVKQILRSISEKSQTAPALLKPISSNGIVTVPNVFSLESNQVLSNVPSASVVTNTSELTKTEVQINHDLPEEVEKTCEYPDVLLLYEQYKYLNMCPGVESVYLKNLLSKMDFNAMHQYLQFFIKFVKASDINLGSQTDPVAWCQELYLRQLEKSIVHFSQWKLTEEACEFAQAAFIAKNSLINKTTSCQFCKYPLPSAHLRVPRSYELGKLLLEISPSEDNILKNVPYMYRTVLDRIQDVGELRSKLPLLIQYSDQKYFEEHLGKMTYDLWYEAISLLATLKSGKCLSCNAEFGSTEGSLEWNTFGKLMIDSIGPRNAINLLRRNVDGLPSKAKFDASFYQYAIFDQVLLAVSGIHDTNGGSFTFPAREGARKEFCKSIDKYLNHQHLKSNQSTTTSSLHEQHQRVVPNSPNSTPTNANCDCCHLPLTIPIIDSPVRLGCGHMFHRVCLLDKDERCCICEHTFLSSY